MHKKQSPSSAFPLNFFKRKFLSRNKTSDNTAEGKLHPDGNGQKKRVMIGIKQNGELNRGVFIRLPQPTFLPIIPVFDSPSSYFESPFVFLSHFSSPFELAPSLINFWSNSIICDTIELHLILILLTLNGICIISPLPYIIEKYLPIVDP